MSPVPRLPVLAALLALAPAQAAPAIGPFAAKVIAGARAEASRATPYVMEYRVIPYPGGDVPFGTGVCTDLLVRAYRAAGIDLQKAVHEDMVANPKEYPRHWDKKEPDSNIDHRRCPNLTIWLRRHARACPTDLTSATLGAGEWQPGDVVFFIRKRDSLPWHVAIVSDRRAPDGMSMLIDSYPPATSESHRLDDFGPIHSHFRWREPAPARARQASASTR